MSETIRVNINDPDSIDDAIKSLKRAAAELKSKSDKALYRVAKLVADTAEAHYASGFLDENDDVNVTISPISNGYVVKASGESVCFLEFGAGAAAGNGYDTSVYEPPVDISPASWSETEGTGEFAKYGSWHYQKRKYTMVVPRMGMYHGVKAAKDNMDRIVNEVFND